MLNKKVLCFALAGVFGVGAVLPAPIFAATMNAKQYAQYKAIKEAKKIKDAVAQKQAFEAKVLQYYKAGLQAYINKNYSQCIQYLTESHVMAKYQGQKDYNVALGESYRQQKNINMALQYQLRAFNLGATDYATVSGIGYDYMDLSNYQKAYPYLLKASQMYPNKVELQWDLGVTCLNLNNEAGVLSSMKKVIALQPNYHPDAYIYIGNVYDNHQRYTDSLAVFKAGLNYFANEGLLWFRAGNSCYQSGYYTDAIPYLQKAAELLPQNLDVYYEWGFSYLNLDNTNDAAEICNIMSKIAPKDSRTVELSNAVNQRIMQKQMEEQMRIDQINQDIQQQQEEANRAAEQAAAVVM